MNIPRLSKSRFIAGLQCPLRLWHQINNPELSAKVSPAQQAVFDMGHEVGRLATRVYPSGVLITEDYLHHAKAVLSTQAALQNTEIGSVYEAAFLENGVRIRVDVLERVSGGKWNLVEVKSSTSVKENYTYDVAIQLHVLNAAGLKIDRVYLMHLNNQYAYDGNTLDLNKLFALSDLTVFARKLKAEVSKLLGELKSMLGAPEPPRILPSRHCKKPYLCEFWEHCTRDMPQHWIMELPGITQKRLDDLEGMGVSTIERTPDTFPLTKIQARIRESVITDSTYVSPKLAGLLTDVEYPVHFLDFETVSPAIPCYAKTKPYQAIPFQWSDHILHHDGTLDHKEYLSEDKADPREEFAQTLLQCLGEEGTIFIYTSYEKTVIKDLAGYLPALSGKLLALCDRFKDLYNIIRNHYYHPAFRGSFSLKSVLPALVPEMSYDDLEIKEGSLASVEYLKMRDPSTTPANKQAIKDNLLTYCGHDTLAMVKIRDELIKHRI